MKIKYHILIVLSFLLLSQIAHTQITFFDNEFENFDYNIKQIDEFILRFNLKELLIQPNQSNNYERDNRTLLFDRKFYLDNSQNINEFLEAIEKQHTILSFYDSTWYAIAKCNVTFQGKKDKITLILRTEKVKDDIYKWSITDAKGSILELTPKTKSDKLRLLPTDNEVNFIALQSVTTANAQNITLYNEKAHVNDRLSVFNCLVYNKLLKIDNVQELSYCFNQVKGYKFLVKDFTRDEKNAGWLIYDVQKIKVKERNERIEDKTLETAKQKILQLYRMLSEYSENPSNISLAKTIQAQFYKTHEKFSFFGTKHIYDDIDVYLLRYSPTYAYVSISDYLNSLDNIAKSGKKLSYRISDIKATKTSGNTVQLTYKVCVVNKDTILWKYSAKATVQDGLIADIVLL